VKNLGGYKGEILRCTQNDKNCRLTAHWYKWCAVRTLHFYQPRQNLFWRYQVTINPIQRLYPGQTLIHPFHFP
jgi:hypothetical protein